jgi:hypothetical protein
LSFSSFIISFSNGSWSSFLSLDISSVAWSCLPVKSMDQEKNNNVMCVSGL